jgi:hypothetical protein
MHLLAWKNVANFIPIRWFRSTKRNNVAMFLIANIRNKYIHKSVIGFCILYGAVRAPQLNSTNVLIHERNRIAKKFVFNRTEKSMFFRKNDGLTLLCMFKCMSFVASIQSA